MIVSRHRRCIGFEGVSPSVDSKAFVAPNASVIGNVQISARASVWYGAVVRGMGIVQSLVFPLPSHLCQYILYQLLFFKWKQRVQERIESLLLLSSLFVFDA